MGKHQNESNYRTDSNMVHHTKVTRMVISSWERVQSLGSTTGRITGVNNADVVASVPASAASIGRAHCGSVNELSFKK